jgi:hypothetical protein
MPIEDIQPEDMVELLEELTLEGRRTQQDRAGGGEGQERLRVAIAGSVRAADASRATEAPTEIRLVEIGTTEFVVESDRPLRVGDLYVLSLDPDEAELVDDAQRTTRCRGCVEIRSRTDARRYKSHCRPFAPVDLRRALAPGAGH